jgi:hypothetical protein
MSRKIMKRIGIGVIGASLVWLLVIGPPPVAVLNSQELAQYRTLANAPYFASPAVGFLAAEPDEAKAFVGIAKARWGGTVFKYVLLRGTIAGKVYALAGLRRTNPRFFWVAVQPFRMWSGEVTTFFGCVMSHETVSSVISSEKELPVRLRPGQTLENWWRSHDRRKEVGLDVVGGGYTAMFLEWQSLVRPAA